MIIKKYLTIKKTLFVQKDFFACLMEIDCSTKQIHAIVSSHAEFCLSPQKCVE